ncbi:mannose-1-phosphate guanylyltransferase/mannose-6-phosphate isomerase [Salinisphaera sp. PC39]|uniref:mannose-1-phosphate guanylyltransferase/mannose-6-phosphate isomerase n=1 Tax=Salinisphaera sp. PC39 TaxID=1304156 RepID=UPI003341C9A1
MLVPVLLAGGSGTRLWPLSREARPKQFLAVTDGESLLQGAIERATRIEGVGDPLVVGREAHRFMIAEHMRRAGVDGRVILEPAARNTAPAVAVAALEALARDDDAMLLVLPSDHVIGDAGRFATAVAAGREAAAQGLLVTFGVEPTRPETGYGYIRAGAPVAGDTCRIEAFVEKPDEATARSYLDAGGYYWNSGMFLFPAGAYLAALATHAPDILEAARAAHEGATRDADFLRLDAEAFAACRSESIDYAVMEKTRDAAVVPLSATWSDLGSWSALAEVLPADADGNVARGDVLLEDTRDSVVYSDGRLIATLGVRDQVIVETTDAVLVADRGREQEIKTLVRRLEAAGRSEASEHRKVYRPWGSYESIASGDRFQVKRIIVSPGGRLSLQMHHHRAEHWVVVQGTAKVTRGDEEMLLTEDQSTYIPLGTTHRLENPGNIDLILIEVQSGGYLGEDDIVRLDDVYGRADKG